MKILFYGGKQAGVIGLLTLLSRGENVVAVISEKGGMVGETARALGLTIYKPEDINSRESKEYIKSLNLDLLVCVHGRMIFKQDILQLPRRGCINVHPCLYKYPGASPIERLLADHEAKASVGVHWMTEEVDAGKVIEEMFVDVRECKTVCEVYNKLYPYYSLALCKALDKLTR